MRTILIAMLVAAGIGFVGTSGSSAAPVTGTGIPDAAAAVDPVDQVQHWRWGSRGHHWRWGSRGHHWRWGSRGHHWRWGSHGHWRWGSHGHWRWGSRF